MKTRTPIFLLFIFTLITLSGCSDRSKGWQGYIENELIYVSSQTTGTLKTLGVHRGDTIQANQTLFILESEPEASLLQAAQANLAHDEAVLTDMQTGKREPELNAILAQAAQAQADLTAAQNNLKRAQKLYATGNLGAEALDNSTAKKNSTAALLQQYQADYAAAKLPARPDLIRAQQALIDNDKALVAQSTWRLSQKTMAAPLSGRVNDTYFWPGDTIAQNQPILSILSPQYTYVIFYVPQPDLPHIKIGLALTISCDGCKQDYHATISYISPQAEYTPPVIYSRTSNKEYVYEVKAALPLNEAQALNPGQPVWVVPGAAE